jgi:rubrerythrin
VADEADEAKEKSMGTDNFSMLEAVEVALNMEAEGIRFYSLAEQKVKDPSMKQLFALLRDKEEHHQQVFRKLYGEFSALEGNPDAELYLLDPGLSEYFRAYVRSTVFPEQGAAEAAIATLHGAEDILRFGLRIEKDSILFYRELLAHHPFPTAKDLIEKVIAEERTHFSFIAAKLKELT